MNTEQTQELLLSARTAGDFLLEAACWRLLAGYVPYRLWFVLTPRQRADVGRFSDELSRLSSVDAIALSDLTTPPPASGQIARR